MRAVADAGPIIHISWIDRLDLLDKLFEEVLLPPTVRDEILAGPSGTQGLTAIVEALNESRLLVRQPSGPGGAISPLEAGETEAIRLARETGVHMLISDEGNGSARNWSNGSGARRQTKRPSPRSESARCIAP